MRLGVKMAGLTAGLAAALTGAAPAVAQEAPRLWNPSPKSMSDYITEGWKVISHTHEQYSNGNDYNFVLQRDNQAVICFVWVPERKDVTSSCRLLN